MWGEDLTSMPFGGGQGNYIYAQGKGKEKGSGEVVEGEGQRRGDNRGMRRMISGEVGDENRAAAGRDPLYSVQSMEKTDLNTERNDN